TWCQLARCSRDRWERIDAEAPVAQQDVRAWNQVGGANGKCSLEDGVVRLLFHEQRNVLERVVVVHAETGADNVSAMSVQVIRESDTRAEALGVVVCWLLYQARCKRAEGCHCLQFLERPAIGNVRTADEVEIPVITQAKICRQPVRNFPVVLEVQAKLLRVLNDERGITHGNAHAVDYF